MFSFEGHYKKPRTINYSKEKDVGKDDLIEKARCEREKRALLSRQNASASKIQQAYKKYTIRKLKRREAMCDYMSLVQELVKENQTFVDERFISMILKISDKLLCFYSGVKEDTKHLKLLIEILVKEIIVRGIINNRTPHNYYTAVTFSLLARVTARHISIIDEDSPPAQYNIFLRFLELFFTSLDTCQYCDSVVKSFHDTFLHFLIESRFFYHMFVFICRQLIRNDESVDSCYKQTKVNAVLKITLLPLELCRRACTLNVAVVQFINNIYSVSPKCPQDNVRRHFQLMRMALLDSIKWHVLVGMVYDNLLQTGGDNRIIPSVGLISFLLGIQPTYVGKPCTITTRATAQILILFSKLSSLLIDNNTFFLSNDLPKEPDTEPWAGTRDNYDFDMKETRSNCDKSGQSSDEEMEDPEPVVVCDLRQMSLIEQEIALHLKGQFSYVVLPLAVLHENESIDETLLIDSVGYVYHLLVLQTKLIGHLESKTFILNLIQTNNTVSRRLWRCIVDQKSRHMSRSVMDALIKWDARVGDAETELFFGKLLCFANCLHWRLLSVQDLDLISLTSDRSKEVLEFSSEELCDIVLKLRDVMCGLICLIYPASSQLVGSKPLSSAAFTEKLTKIFVELQRVVVRLYNRDVRKGLRMSGKRLDWVKTDVCRVNVNNIKSLRLLLLDDYKFGRSSSRQLTVAEMRQFVVLKEMPFVVPIGTRMHIFKHVVGVMDSSTSLSTYSERTSVRIRRTHVYEDAFSQITRRNVPNLRAHLQIEFVDQFGFDEAGIDGGGLLREFLAAVVREACDPKRGLFVSTRNNLLYPNPEVESLHPENWRAHLHFVGRILGLVVSKGLLVEVPLAPFFLQRLFSSRLAHEEVDIDNLQYLDEDLYRNLLSLKSLPGVEEMSLDFTVARSCFGAASTVDLKPGGSNILVTDENKIEYIYLMADYKLHRQIAAQTDAIVEGLNDVLAIECFQLFDLDEISLIVTGGGAALDMDDLRRNTVYHGPDGTDSSATIDFFWQVVAQMTEEEKRSFVQFVTSLSRAPMLGFGELSPKFAIVIVPDTDRLPTASTCLNLLKLPAYKNLEEMRQRLLYAIGSDTGFHLS